MSTTLLCPRCGNPYGSDEHHECPESAAHGTGTVEELSAFAASFDLAPDQRLSSLGRELQIVCGDCGRQLAFRGKCGRCGGKSWIEANEWARIVKEGARRRRRMAAMHALVIRARRR